MICFTRCILIERVCVVVAEQQVALCIRGNGVSVGTVGCARVREILMVRFILINVIEIVREEAVIAIRRMVAVE